MDRIADTVARSLAAAGVRHAFGMPGGEVVTLLDALAAAGIGFVLARHESAAAIMAAGASIATGAPGLLVTTLGPGLANAVNGIADAQQERVPLLVISGVVERGLRGRYTHQIIDHAALLRPLVKASLEIEPDAAAATVARAVALATTPPCGPVHLDLSPTVAAAADPVRLPPRPPAVTAVPRPDPADPGLAALRARLEEARRPLLLAGFEAARSGAAPAVTGLAEHHGVPVITTYKAKGVIDEMHPLALGGVGLSPAADRVFRQVAARADLVLLAGYDPIEMRPGWLDPFAAAAEVVEVTSHPADHGMHRVDRRLIGEVGPILAALQGERSGRRVWPGGEPERARQDLAALFALPEGWHAAAVIATLNERLPETAIVTVDSGAHRILLSQMWRARRPLSLLQSAGFCTMAAALPLAAGVKAARPDRPVLAVLGDGGLEMGLGELGTLRDQGLPVVLVVLQDASLGLIELKQRQAGLARLGVGLGRTDLPGVARAFGGRGIAVASTAELLAELAEALTAPTFTLIACPIDLDSYDGRL